MSTIVGILKFISRINTSESLKARKLCFSAFKLLWAVEILNSVELKRNSTGSYECLLLAPEITTKICTKPFFNWHFDCSVCSWHWISASTLTIAKWGKMKKVSKQCLLDPPPPPPPHSKSRWKTLASYSSNCSIKSGGRSWLAHEGTIYAYTKALLGKNCLSSHSCHFVKIILCEPNPFMNIFNVSTLYWQSIKLFHQKL